MKFRWMYPLAVLLLVLGMSLAAGCGGGGEEEEEAERPAAAVEGEADEGGAAEEEGEAEPRQVEEPAAAFADLQSYRYVVRFDVEGTSTDEGALEGTFSFDLSIEGAFVAPDRTQVKVSGAAFGLDLEEEAITIGDRTWVRTNGNWEEGDAELASGDFSPASFAGAFDAEDLRVLKPSKETVNGVRSLRYKIDRANIAEIARLASFFGGGPGLEDLPENFDIDLWLAEDGMWPVRLVMSASGDIGGGEGRFDFSMDVMDVNDESIEIEPPI